MSRPKIAMQRLGFIVFFISISSITWALDVPYTGPGSLEGTVQWWIAKGDLSMVELAPNATCCASEKLRLVADWQATLRNTPSRLLPDTIQLELVNMEKGANIILQSTTQLHASRYQIQEPQLEDSAAKQSRSVIECELDIDFCTPVITGMRLPNITDEVHHIESNHLLLLDFYQATNCIDLSSTHSLHEAILFGTYIGDTISGNWSEDCKTLAITIQNVALDKVTTPFAAFKDEIATTHLLKKGSTQNDVTDPRINASLSYTNDVEVRLMLTGEFFLRVLLLKTDVDASDKINMQLDSTPFTVVACDDAIVIHDANLTVNEHQVFAETKLVEPVVFIDSVLTFSGTQSLKLLDSEIQTKSPGSWALSFWMFTTAAPSDAFRAIFFHGNGEGEQRTPSVWWKPNERRFLLRVSTDLNTDIGLESQSDIPIMEWVHVGFTFYNCTEDDMTESASHCHDKSKAEEPWNYSFSFYLNGILDQEVLFFTRVISNNGPLQIGNSPWSEGMRGFVSQLRVYNEKVSEDEHYKRYLDEKHFHPDLQHTPIPSTNSSYYMHAASQISFILQTMVKSKSRQDEQDALNHDKHVEGDFSDTGRDVYDIAKEAIVNCDPSWLDTLHEAASLQSSNAQLDLGIAYLFGRYTTDETARCHDGTLGDMQIDLNLTRSKAFLLEALDQGKLKASEYLALIVQMSTYENVDDDMSFLSKGFYHITAAKGRPEAFMTLGNVYRKEGQVDAAAFHYFQAAADASVTYHSRGQQLLHEAHRLYDGLQDDITKGERGENDEVIQYQQMRADKDGDVDAMVAMGNLYYWGIRGVPRDQERALQYFERAADAGNLQAQSALANMLLRGEGTEQDNATAIKWYKKAAEENDTRALNGLGFLHFYGSGGLDVNRSRALELFELAAMLERDGDSLFNAGLCYANGHGTSVDYTKAMHYYQIAAKKFGHFDAILELGRMHMHGVDALLDRSSRNAIPYLMAAAEGGRWGAVTRDAFNYYLDNDFHRAAVLYEVAYSYGYSVSVSNLAYLYDTKLLQVGDNKSEARALHALLRAHRESGDLEVLVRIGDYYFYGMGSIAVDYEEALRWYSRASAKGIAQGAYSAGTIYEHGYGVDINLDRAERYYHRLLELSQDSTDQYIVARLALSRLFIHRWIPALRPILYSSNNTVEPSALPFLSTFIACGALLSAVAIYRASGIRSNS